MSSVLITGGLGYVGSHVAVELVGRGHQVVIFDDGSNSDIETFQFISELAGNSLKLVVGNIFERDKLKDAFLNHGVDTVVHCAALKDVRGSFREALAYYQNNFQGTLKLFEVMRDCGISKLVFSSSAAAYGNVDVPAREDTETLPLSPYGNSKFFAEQFLRDLATSDPALSIVVLRYFNLAGAHKTARIGHDPKMATGDLVSKLIDVAMGREEELLVYGNDYPTEDGTAVRDYVHIEDLAIGNVSAVEFLNINSGFFLINLGSGIGTSVKVVIDTFEGVWGRKLPHRFIAARQGDLVRSYASVDLASDLLGWDCSRSLLDMLESALAFEQVKLSRRIQE